MANSEPGDRRPTQLGAWILTKIDAAGLGSQRGLARAAGVSPSTITRIISGDGTPDTPTLRKIAAALDVDAGELLTRAGHDRPAGNVEPVTLHPLAVDLSRLLMDDRLLTDADRQYLADMVDKLIKPYRRALRRRRAA